MSSEVNSDFSPNQIVNYLKKPPASFTRDDIIRYMSDNGIGLLNFRYVAGDGKLKTLNFVITSRRQLEALLSTGERVDGSNVYSYIEPGASDLYVVPRFNTAFLNPFAPIPSLDMLCSFFNKDGDPLDVAPENTMRKAHNVMKRVTGYSLDVMGELEYYVISNREDIYLAKDQKGYHESPPFTKWENLRTEAMKAIAQVGGQIKYGHSEVGNFSDDTHYYEQNEIEFTTTPLEQAADQLILAKWILRMVGYKYGVTVSFAPKITIGRAGSGLHIHMKLKKDGCSAMVDDGRLSDPARKAIAGILDISGSLTAFGNTIPTSYLRLVPHQEAPTSICWGDRNRSVLIRVPLGWSGKASRMINLANPCEEEAPADYFDKQTIEFRCPDGSADIYLLMAGLAVGVRHGFELKNALEMAEKLYVDVNIFEKKHKERLKHIRHLPASCWQSADELLEQAAIFTKHQVFTEVMLKGLARDLKAYNDLDLSERLYGKTDEIRELVKRYLHHA